jgi:hypothetical protein
VRRMLKETFTMVDRNVLQPVWISPKVKIRGFLPDFPQPSLF